jgi:hypothetical protein
MRVKVVFGCVLAAGLAIVSTAGPAYAGFVVAPAPEIDGTSIIAGIGLVGAGALLLRARRRAK